LKVGDKMAEALTGINGEIIKWAREYYNMSIDSAASAIGVDVYKYSNWENGKEFPTYAKLKKISSVFNRPSAVFFFPKPPALQSIKGDLRTLSDYVINALSKDVIMQFEKARVYQINLRELYGEKESFLSNRNLFPSEIYQLCSYVRKIIDFPLGSQKAIKSNKDVFEIFRERFYKLGIYVFKDSFRDNGISGLCINDDMYPIIIINNSMPFTRQNFTLFHELYHLITDTSGAEIIRDDFYVYLNDIQRGREKACDIFANEFLVPSDDFKIELKKQDINEKRIEELALLYSVSKEVIMYKLLQMKKISNDDYDSLKETFYGEAIRNQSGKKSKQNSGRNYYSIKLSYLGQKYTTDVFTQYFSGKIDGIRASEMLNSKIDHLPKLENALFRRLK